MSFGPKPWQQLHWDARAAANFMLGGTGAGLLVAWAVSAAVTPAWQAYVLAGMACIGLVTIRDQCAAERLAQHITDMTWGP